MDKLRIVPLAFVCWLLGAPALAQITTIDPGTPGVTESIITLQQTSVVNGAPFYSPTFTKVALGSLPGGFDQDFFVASCLDGCVPPEPAVVAGFSVFDVSFSKPVSFITVLQMGIFDGNGAEVLAFNNSLHEIGSCLGVFAFPGPPSFSSPPGCYVVTSGTNANGLGLGNFTVSLSKPDITMVLIAGGDGSPAFGTAVQFSVAPIATSEPATLALMFLGLAGVGFAVRRRKG